MKTRQTKILFCVSVFLVGMCIGALTMGHIAQSKLNDTIARQEEILDHAYQFVADSFTITPDIKSYNREAGSIQFFESKGPTLVPLSSDPSNKSPNSDCRLDINRTYTMRYEFPDELRESLKNNHIVQITVKYSSKINDSNDAKIHIDFMDLMNNSLYSCTRNISSAQNIRLTQIFDTSESYPQLTGDHLSLTFTTSAPTADAKPTCFRNILYFDPYTYYLVAYNNDY